jgi:FtsP/CotA-like multicopper oxidase with cupredoxin domain
MVADNPGEWMYHCRVNDHIEAGMMGRYIINPVSPDP